MRILIIEDEVFLAEALMEIFKKNEYLVDAVYNGIVQIQSKLFPRSFLLKKYGDMSMSQNTTVLKCISHLFAKK